MDSSASNLAVADYTVIAGFFVVMLAIGIYFYGRMRNLQDYFSGSRQVPWWLSGISFYMSSFSAFTFIAYSELAYKYGWVAVTAYWVTIPASLISAYFFASRWRRAAVTSPLEYIEERYGPALRQWLAWLGIPVKVIDDGLKLFAIGTLVSSGMGFPLEYAVFISGIIVLLYTFMGGLWAVLVTDFVQFIVMLIAVLVLLPLAFQKVGGFETFVGQAPEGFFAITADKYTWSYLFTFFVIITLNYCTSWSLVQRYYSVNSDKNARKVGYMVAIMNVLAPPILFAPAMAARVFMPEVENTTEVYALLCRTLLPIGMMGMIIAAMFSATLSMLSSDYNAVASVLTNDVYKRLIAPQASDRSLVYSARFITLLIGLISLGIALLVNQGESDLFQLMVKVFSLFLPPIALPMLAGLISRRVSNAGGLTGLILGMSVGLTAFWIGAYYPILRKEQYITAITFLTTLLGMGVGTLFFPTPLGEKKNIENFYQRVISPEADLKREEVSRESIFTPLPVIGLSLLGLGLLLIVVVLFAAPLAEAGLSLGVGFGMVVIGGLFLFGARRTKRKDMNQ